MSVTSISACVIASDSDFAHPYFCFLVNLIQIVLLRLTMGEFNF